MHMHAPHHPATPQGLCKLAHNCHLRAGDGCCPDAHTQTITPGCRGCSVSSVQPLQVTAHSFSRSLFTGGISCTRCVGATQGRVHASPHTMTPHPSHQTRACTSQPAHPSPRHLESPGGIPGLPQAPRACQGVRPKQAHYSSHTPTRPGAPQSEKSVIPLNPGPGQTLHSLGRKHLFVAAHVMSNLC